MDPRQNTMLQETTDRPPLQLQMRMQVLRTSAEPMRGVQAIRWGNVLQQNTCPVGHTRERPSDGALPRLLNRAATSESAGLRRQRGQRADLHPL